MKLFSQRYLFKRVWKRLAVACFDGLGSILFFPFRFIRHPFDLAQIRRILVIRLDHIGDVVMTRPALSALKKHFPQASIDLLISEELVSLFANCDEVNRVFGMQHHWFSRRPNLLGLFKELKRLMPQIRREGYEVVFDFRGDLRNILLMFFLGIPHRIGFGMTGGGFLLTQQRAYRPNGHQVLLNLYVVDAEAVASAPAALEPFSYTLEAGDQFWNTFGKELGLERKPRIVLHAGAGYPSKRWSQEKMAELIKILAAKNLGELVLIGTEEEKHGLPAARLPNRVIDLRGRTRITDLPILFDHADLFIGHDSGPAHIAAAQGTPMIILFSGTNDYRLWHPWSPRLELIRHDVPCSPCAAKDCPLKHHDCMEKITVAQVLQKVESHISDS